VSARRLESRVAVVTGGASGIGAAASRRLSQDGARVVVVGLDGAAAAGSAADLPGQAIGVAADVATEAGVEAYSAAALEAFGGVDLAFLNAGMGGRMAPIAELEADEFDRVVAVNLRGVFLGLRAALRQMHRGGAVVVTTSTAGLHGSNLAAYSAAKHGAVALVRSAAVEGAAAGVRVNGIAPDSIETPMMGARRTAGRRRGGAPPARGDDAARARGEPVRARGGGGRARGLPARARGRVDHGRGRAGGRRHPRGRHPPPPAPRMRCVGAVPVRESRFPACRRRTE
jgi:NAD(P)-dependent dehydrogenase (short-subunit alcohol dehydrogenase family)